MIQSPSKPVFAPPVPAAPKKTTSSTPISDEGEIETFTILYVTPDGFLPPLALALIRERNGRLLMAQGDDSEHLKIGREVYLRRTDDFTFYRQESSSEGARLFEETSTASSRIAF
jgi:hypothetical protein